MNKQLVSLFLLVPVFAFAGRSDSTIVYHLPDSVKAVQYIATVQVSGMNSPKRFSAGISVSGVAITLSQHNGKKSIGFQMHELSHILVKGRNVRNTGYGSLYLEYPWQENVPYKLLIAVAADSAENRSIWSAYVFLPEQQKWKLIGTRQYPFGYSSMKQPIAIIQKSRKNKGRADFSDVWVQRSSGSWKYMDTKPALPPSPVVYLFGHVDSVAQQQEEIKRIEDSIAADKTDVRQQLQTVYYKLIREGIGRPVTVTDTVTVFYKGYLFANGSVFDQTKNQPATFPLQRLIRGWQIGLPLCKTGGAIKLVIPSSLAYSIRTRSAKIPPNSILVFEIEIVDSKPATGSQ